MRAESASSALRGGIILTMALCSQSAAAASKTMAFIVLGDEEELVACLLARSLACMHARILRSVV